RRRRRDRRRGGPARPDREPVRGVEERSNDRRNEQQHERGFHAPRGPTRSAAPASTSSAGVGRGGEGGGRAAAGEAGAGDVPEGSGSATWRDGGQACEGWAHAVRVLWPGESGRGALL